MLNPKKGSQRFFTLLVILILSNLATSKVNATHIIGGNLGYEYLGLDSSTAGNHRYKVSLDVYLDCNSSGWVGNGGFSFPERLAQVGIFEGQLNPGGPVFFSQSLNLVLTDSNRVQGNLPTTCNPLNLISSLCVYLIHYEETVSLPASNTGYWIINDRCCRPGGILNLNSSNATPNTFTTWVPAQNGALISNSSPQFTDTLVTYICLGDTAFISNAAIDPDGDSLVYSLETPYAGRTNTFTPATTYNSFLLNPYDIPPNLVTYAGGYDLVNLLGPTGYTAINTNSGVTSFSANTIGKFVASVEIKEYRAGIMVGVTRRNMQLICDNCPNNNAPTQNTSQIDSTAITPTLYKINAGDSFCFDLNYTDLDNDPLEFIANGTIFNPARTNPAATVTSPVFGTGNVTGTICWSTSCSQGTQNPYSIRVMVSDSNCPPRPIIQDIEILVNPFVGPQQIFGDSIVCVDRNARNLFSADTMPNVTYSWSVAGGSIISGNGTPSITVSWAVGQTSATISLTSSNQNGCIDGPITRNVVLADITADAGSDTSYCQGDFLTLGGNPTSINPNNSISWSPITGLSNPNSANPVATPSSSTTYIVELTHPLGCIGRDTILVEANTPISSGLDSSYFLCPGDTLTLSVIGDSFIWSPNTFISDTSVFNPKLYPPNNQTYFLNYFDTNGCEGNDTTNIIVNGTIPTNAGSDKNTCSGDSVQLGGNPTSPIGSTYIWSPSLNLNNTTIPNPTVFSTVTTTYIVRTSNDTCSGIDSVLVNVLPEPNLVLSSDTFTCITDSIQISATGIGSFLWNNGSSLSDSTIANPIAFPNTSTVYIVTLTDINFCTAIDSINVEVKQLPIANAGNVVDACKFLPVTIGGSPTGPLGSTYLWTPNTGLNFNELANPLVSIGNDVQYFVMVTDSFGCMGIDSVQVTIFRAFDQTDTSYCDSIQVVLNPNLSNGTSPFTYSWSPVNLVSNSTGASTQITVGQSNTYAVTVTDSQNCRDTLNYTINSLQASEAIFSYELIPTCNGVGVKITNQSVGAVEFEWTINGTTVSNDFEPILVFNYGTTIDLSLLTRSMDDCTDRASVRIIGESFEELLQVEISNVFTPNADGVNDYFELTFNGDLAQCIDLNIFNRDGVLVHQSNGGVHSWDGRSSVGKEYPAGVYFYILSINGMEYKGNLTLFREN